MPTNLIELGFNRNFSSVTQSTLGGAMPSVFVTATTHGGFYTNSVQLPEDLDPTKPIDVLFRHGTRAVTPDNGKDVVLRLAYDYIETDGSIVQQSFDLTWPVPDDWAPGDIRTVLLDNGSGHTVPPNTFPPQTFTGWRVSRVGSAAGDTYDRSTEFPLALVLAYTSRYPWLAHPI